MYFVGAIGVLRVPVAHWGLAKAELKSFSLSVSLRGVSFWPVSAGLILVLPAGATALTLMLQKIQSSITNKPDVNSTPSADIGDEKI